MVIVYDARNASECRCTYSFVCFPGLITGAHIFSPKQVFSSYKAGPYRWKTPVTKFL